MSQKLHYELEIDYLMGRVSQCDLEIDYLVRLITRMNKFLENRAPSTVNNIDIPLTLQVEIEQVAKGEWRKKWQVPMKP